MIGEDENASSKKQSGDSETDVSEDKTKSAEKAAASLINKNVDASSYRYEDNKCFYIDPASGVEFEWDEEKKEWLSQVTDTTSNPIAKDYKFNGETYFYTDDSSKTTYKWDLSKNEWVMSNENGQGDLVLPPSSNTGTIGRKHDDSDMEEFDDDEKPEIKRQDMSQGTYGFDGASHTYTDSKDGTVYIWDKEKSAWFPKVDDDFLARYQMSYGFSEPSENPLPSEQETKTEEKIEPEKPSSESLKRKQEASWFEVDEKNNTKVYVSNLPLDMTEKELIDLMQKCGLVMKELDSNKFKIKMYTDPQTGSFKGDALCTYIKVESVQLALSILDGCLVKDKKITVERAKFQMKGDYNPSLKPKKKNKKQIEKIKKIQQKLLDWRPDKLRGEREKHERVVIVKNLFDPTLFDKQVGLILEYQQDLREEASKCGHVKKITIYDRHPEGVAQIMFREAEAADACKELLHNRWFGQRQLTAQTWDGKTKYTVVETEEQKAERLKNWEKFIEEDEKKAKLVSEKHDSGDDTRSSAGSDLDTDDDDDNTIENKNTTDDSQTKSAKQSENS